MLDVRSMYCRVCQFQADSKDNLEAHWSTKDHKVGSYIFLSRPATDIAITVSQEQARLEMKVLSAPSV